MSFYARQVLAHFMPRAWRRRVTASEIDQKLALFTRFRPACEDFLKERIEDHRNQAACMSCHAKIDPWRIAFENFDAVGSWRDTINNEPDDASSLLFNHQRLDGVDGLKRFLLENRQDQIARAIVKKMTAFALGRPLRFGDRASIDQITSDLRRQGDGLGTLGTAH